MLSRIAHPLFLQSPLIPHRLGRTQKEIGTRLGSLRKADCRRPLPFWIVLFQDFESLQSIQIRFHQDEFHYRLAFVRRQPAHWPGGLDGCGNRLINRFRIGQCDPRRNFAGVFVRDGATTLMAHHDHHLCVCVLRCSTPYSTLPARKWVQRMSPLQLLTPSQSWQSRLKSET